MLGMLSCKKGTNEPLKANYALMTISADADKEVMTSYSASIEGRQDIKIYPQVSGYIEKLNEYGKQGWRLISGTDDWKYSIFEREIDDEE